MERKKWRQLGGDIYSCATNGGAAVISGAGRVDATNTRSLKVFPEYKAQTTPGSVF